MRAPNYAVNRFTSRITNGAGQPANTLGTSITPGNNTFPAYAQILVATAHETFFCMVHVHSNFTAGQARNTLVNIGVDEAGGTTWVTKIPNLLVTDAVTYLGAGAGGIFFGFPLYIPSGASLAAQASVNNATVGTLRVIVTLLGQPSRPESVWAGTYVTSFGEATGTSTGTEVTPGTTSEGAYTQLGSNTALPHWWWQQGFGTNDASLSPDAINMDIAYGDSTNKHLIIEDEIVAFGSNENISKGMRIDQAYAPVPSGAGIFGRMQASALQASHQMIAYGLGG